MHGINLTRTRLRSQSVVKPYSYFYGYKENVDFEALPIHNNCQTRKATCYTDIDGVPQMLILVKSAGHFIEEEHVLNKGVLRKH